MVYELEQNIANNDFQSFNKEKEKLISLFKKIKKENDLNNIK